MPSYQYKGRNPSGALVSGQLQAASADLAAAELSGGSIVPIEIVEVRAARPSASAPTRESRAASGVPAFLTGKKVELGELIIFSRQMYSLTKAGLPLDRALRGLEASISSPGLKSVLRDVAAQLEKGMNLTDSLSRHPKIFSSLYLSLVHVGENTGRLDLAFQQVAKYLELERNTSKQVKSATRYPLFVVVAIAVALAVIMVFVIPVFADTFQRLDAQLPWQTILLINVSNFAVAYWPYMLGAMAGGWLAFRHWTGTAGGRLSWDRRKLSLPLAGGIFERISLARFCRTFAMMMKAGVPIVQSLGVIARAVGNRHVGENVEKMREGISHGESLYQTALKSGMFTPLVLQMIAVGEESGSIDELLGEAADFYEAEVEYDLKRMSSAIEPILIICIAGMVLILALGVFLPIWDLANAAR